MHADIQHITLTQRQFDQVVAAATPEDPMQALICVWTILLGHHPQEHPHDIIPGHYQLPQDQAKKLLEAISARLSNEVRVHFLLQWCNIGPSTFDPAELCAAS